jgi:REP element-mobilizing transposase RayT
MWASAPTEASVPSLVRSWKTLVSKEVGRSIWQRSYYDHIIRDEQDYLIKAKYIAENPARWEKDDYYVIG